jgi:uncharacterized protein YlxW (UPF0749 family)
VPVPWDVVLQLGVAGGFALAAIGAGVALKMVFDAWRHGDLVSRPVHDAIVTQLTDSNAVLRKDVEDLTATVSRLTDVLEAVGRTLQDHDQVTRERLATIEAEARRR